MTDLISRADAIAYIDRVIKSGLGRYKSLNYIRKYISALPSAELPKGDLISRQWLLDLYGDYIGDNGDPKYHVPLEVVRQNIIDAPSADAAQVVRCKDCRFRYTNYGHAEVYDECRWVQGQRPNDDDYCSYGKRKGGDTE